MRSLVAEAGLEGEIEIESAGTGDWHVGRPADPRARDAAALRGIDLDGVARQFEGGDFDRFDRIVVMDRQNLADVLAIAPDEAAAEKVVLLREYDPAADGELDVPDPYHGDGDGFETVLDIVERSCRELLAECARTSAKR
jgi:protein-tyrosine phosphatase